MDYGRVVCALKAVLEREGGMRTRRLDAREILNFGWIYLGVVFYIKIFIDL